MMVIKKIQYLYHCTRCGFEWNRADEERTPVCPECALKPDIDNFSKEIDEILSLNHI
jgi:hypothetical protein